MTEAELRNRMMAVILRASIAEQARALRLDRKLTQQQVAEGIGSKPSVISNLENPRGQWMTVATLRQVAAFFDVSLLIRFESWSEWIKKFCEGPLDVPKPFEVPASRADELAELGKTGSQP